ncbi:hypothetical protein [Paenibacillus barengoltzii]|uniref:hypothetical protein n=1 Tax=Paenibacillus barengoltzii TaxID=343517 RepID=UPI0038797887
MDNVDEMFNKALAHGAKAFIEPANLSVGEPILAVRNALIHSPKGEVIEFIEDVDFDMSAKTSKIDAHKAF